MVKTLYSILHRSLDLTDKPYFGVSLIVFIVLLSGLTFIPVLLLGPIGEFLTLK